MKNVLLIAVATIGLIGCSSVPLATKMTPDQSQGFFSAGKDAKGGTVYFTCGRQTVSTLLMTSQTESPTCQYSVNSTLYKAVAKGSVGRLDLKTGTYEIRQPAESSLAVIVPLKLEARPGDVALVKANYEVKQGGLGGALSGAHISSVEYDKDEVLEKIKGKQPVLMEPLPTTN